jgi:hypothetical protein
VTKQLNLLPRRVGAYWGERGQTPEFTLAAADPWPKHLLVGELCWENGRLTTADLERLVHDSQQLPQIQAEGWTVEQVMFGRRPFKENICQAAITMDVRLVTLAEIEPLLLTARAQRRWERDNPSPIEIEF